MSLGKNLALGFHLLPHRRIDMTRPDWLGIIARNSKTSYDGITPEDIENKRSRELEVGFQAEIERAGVPQRRLSITPLAPGNAALLGRRTPQTPYDGITPEGIENNSQWKINCAYREQNHSKRGADFPSRKCVVSEIVGTTVICAMIPPLARRYC